jgi:hypothetical protein
MPEAVPFPNNTSSAGSFTGKDRSMTASSRLKMAVLAPMPKASESRATTVIAGLRNMARLP